MIYAAQHLEHPGLVAYAFQILPESTCLGLTSPSPWSGMGSEMKSLDKPHREDLGRRLLSLGLILGHFSDKAWVVFRNASLEPGRDSFISLQTPVPDFALQTPLPFIQTTCTI